MIPTAARFTKTLCSPNRQLRNAGGREKVERELRRGRWGGGLSQRWVDVSDERVLWASADSR